MSKFIVWGGKPLKGTYVVSGAKNAGPKLPIAALLSNEKCIFHNIPRISDTYRTVDALTSLGCSVRFVDKNSVEVECADIYSSEIPLEAMSARQAVLFIGATLARTGKVIVYPPKGDAIGKRPLNRHLEGIKALGGHISRKNNRMEISMPTRPQSVTYTFEKNTHCGTENLILASVFNIGKVILKNAAEEPEVDNLIKCLNDMGAKIKRIESRVIEIRGVEPLLKGVESFSIFDRLEAATAIILSVMTGGNIAIKNAHKELLEPLVKTLKEIGVEVSFKKNIAKIVKIKKPLKSTEIITDWHPGFMTDWQPLITLMLAYMASGKSMIHERIFETRWRYLEELQKMGLRYDLFHPDAYGPEYYNFNDSEYDARETYAVNVYGPTDLQPAELNSHDVRAGIDMLLASIIANGKSIISDPQNHIDRGYENIVEKLNELGADIKRV
ncbi:MAG: UDP-N-acetylglucosamine 1-carboxyvinyltransferase [Parcubacteria group bacterium Gr01-1014_2]|nr:MAG: UDP-N-acetylglucosamine 1-carboxyvinyltransferase [Parcubacteria group bacterium Gr01-1014_2]